MALSVNIGPAIAHNDRPDHAHEERRAEARQGDAQVAATFDAGQRSVSKHRQVLATRSEAAAQNAAELARLTQRGTQENARAAHAADPQPPSEQPDPTAQANPETHAAENLPTQPPATEQPTPTQEAAAQATPQQEAHAEDHMPRADTAGEPAGSHNAPAVPNAPSRPQESAHAGNNPQPGQGETGSEAGPHAQPQTAQNSRTLRRPATAQPEVATTTPENPHQPEGATASPTPRTPTQQLALLQNGGVAPSVNNPHVTPGATTPTPPTPLAQAHEPLPQGAVKVFDSGGMNPEHAEAYAGLVKSGLTFAQLELSRPQGPQAAPLQFAAQQAAAPAMTFAGLREVRERERQARQGIAGIVPREGRNSRSEGELAGLVGRGMYHSVRG